MTFQRPNCALVSGCWIRSGRKRRRGMGTENTLAGCELERTAKTEMGIQLESGNGAVTEVQERRRVKTSRFSRQRIQRRGIILFVILAVFTLARTLHRE